jgi:cytochrome c oxidase cbb3-type subunit I/II
MPYFNNLEVPLSFTGWKSYSACRCKRCISTMVVWTQCSSIFPYNTSIRYDVLLRTESSRPTCISYKLYYTLLVPDIRISQALTICSIQHYLLGLQALGTGFSIMLIAPSWERLMNYNTERCLGQSKRKSVLKFVVAITCYGMATFEGPLLATKT